MNAAIFCARGSSPLARGLLVGEVLTIKDIRIIPARAGFTIIASTVDLELPDHPRSRGVYVLSTALLRQLGGSSPLARGLHKNRLRKISLMRIIPARAGFTPGTASGSGTWRDHPRSRGVYDNNHTITLAENGSSPLARGLPNLLMLARIVLRIIPARAGFTRQEKRGEEYPGDHPRSRGVYPRMLNSSRRRNGSSPLARGLQIVANLPQKISRIIPARAGFTASPSPVSLLPPDHPRSRGVYNMLLKVLYSLLGSSPLARGLPDDERADGWRCRIIPARAGFTVVQLRARSWAEDHPRSRGVYDTSVAAVA